jgi:hypothetical protein
MFTADDIIYTYTREQAIEDGELIDACSGVFAEITCQFFKIPVAMTRAVFAIIERSVASRTHYNDYKGVWHDMMWLCFLAARRTSASQLSFQVIITGAGRKRYHTFKAVISALSFDNDAPCMTIMLPDED